MEYEHPLYTPDVGRRPAPAARDRHRPDRLRRRLPRLGLPRGRRALRRSRPPSGSGCDVGRADGPPAGADAAASTRPTIRHTRRTPFRRTFEHRSHTWLVDLDDLPDHGARSAAFEARDHLGDPDAHDPRERRRASSPTHGVDLHGGRVLMAAQRRAPSATASTRSASSGAIDRDRRARRRRRRGAQHLRRPARLPRPPRRAAAGRRTDKEMYVSPFHGTDGTYDARRPACPATGSHVARHPAHRRRRRRSARR